MEIVSGLWWESVSTSFSFRAPSGVNPCMPYVCILWVSVSPHELWSCWFMLVFLMCSTPLVLKDRMAHRKQTPHIFGGSLSPKILSVFCLVLLFFIYFLHIHYGFWVCVCMGIWDCVFLWDYIPCAFSWAFFFLCVCFVLFWFVCFCFIWLYFNINP